MTIDRRISRRTALHTAGATVLGASIAGCLDVVGVGSPGAHEDVVLNEPDGYDQRADADLPYPIHGEEFPEATVPDPLADQKVSSRELVDERHVLATFVFTRCPGVCPALTSTLRHVQADASDEGYADEVALLTYTFDPEYDTPERLQEYGEAYGVDFETDNWHFLRPESPERAEEVVYERFGVYFEKLAEAEREQMDMHEDMAFQHDSVIFLANAAGYVERTYAPEPPDPTTVLEDVHTLRERW